MAAAVRCVRHLLGRLAVDPISQGQSQPLGLAAAAGAGAGAGWLHHGRVNGVAALAAQLRGLSTLPTALESPAAEAVESTEGGVGQQESPAPPPPKYTLAAVKQAADVGYSVQGRFDGSHIWIKRQQAFAVVQVGSHQFKVTPGDLIYTEKLKYTDINDKLALEKVLLVGTTTKTIIGRPTVPNTTVYAAVEEHALDAKVIIFKKKRRKNYRRCKGHRQELTALRILNINGFEEVKDAGQLAKAA